MDIKNNASKQLKTLKKHGFIVPLCIRNKIKNIKQLSNLSASEFLALPQSGTARLQCAEDLLSKYGLSFNAKKTKENLFWKIGGGIKNESI